MVMNVCVCVRVYVYIHQLLRQRIMFFMFMSSVKTLIHVHTHMLQSGAVSQCEGGGVCCWCHPFIPVTSICGGRPARLAVPPSAGPDITFKM